MERYRHYSLILNPWFTSTSPRYLADVYRIPDSMSFEEAALCEPLCVALQAHQRLGLQGDDVLIIGGGTIGLLCAALWEPRRPHIRTLTIAGSMNWDSKLIKILMVPDSTLQRR